MRRVLLVGIDHYETFKDLNGCVNDALALMPLLERRHNGDLNFTPRLLLARSDLESMDDNGGVTRDDFLSALDELFAPGVDMSLLYFSGHGAPTESGDDVWLVTTDASSTTRGIRFSEIQERVSRKDSPGAVLVILDCCFSGGAGGVPAALTKGDVLRRGLTMLTASRGDQVSYEYDGRGIFSTFLQDALEGGAADIVGQVIVASLYAYLSEAFGPWDQRPMLKASVDRLHSIRQCEPRVQSSTLRKLPDWFPFADYQFPLSPAYEPDKEKSGLPPEPALEETFRQLQALHAAELVRPVGEEHMYFAAMNSKACELTRVGKHYRDLAARKLL